MEGSLGTYSGVETTVNTRQSLVKMCCQDVHFSNPSVHPEGLQGGNEEATPGGVRV